MVEELDLDHAGDDQDDAVALVVAAEGVVAGQQHVGLAVEQELAQLQRGEAAQQRQPLLDQLQRLRNGRAARHAQQSLLQELLVRRLDRAAGDRLDHLVALVQALLDQRIAGERADGVEARHVGLVAGAHLRVAGAALGQFDAAGFQELARRVGAEAGEHQIAGIVLHAVGRLERDRPALDLHRRGLIGALQQARANRLLDRDQVAGLGAGELRLPVDDGDLVLLGERDRVLDRGVAGADHDDALLGIGLGVVELVLDHRRLVAGHAELAQVALQADGEDDVLGLDGAALGQGQREGPLASAHGRDGGAVADVQAGGLDLLGPGVEHALAARRLERHVAAPWQDVRRRHDELAAGVFLDRVGMLGLALEQHMRQAELGRARGGTQATRPGTDDRDLEAFHARCPRCYGRSQRAADCTRFKASSATFGR